MSIFEGVLSQYIDVNGKTRALNYEDISLSTSPLPPLDVKESPIDDIKLATIRKALEFIRKYDLEITEQDGDEKSKIIQGLWVKSRKDPPPIVFGYIPIEIPKKKTNALNNVPFSTETTTDPLFVGTNSELDTFRINSKIAEYLKQYSLFEWANDSENFGMDNFKIIPNHKYDLKKLNSRIIRGNDVLYKGNRLIVNDEETAKRLINFVKVSSLNDSTIIDRYKNKRIIDGSSLYTSIVDFRTEKKQLVFLNREGVLQWKMEKSRDLANSNVYSQPRPWNKEAYYYRNLNIENGKLMIIQNTEDGDFPSALAVSKMWETRTINPGYNPDPDIYVPEDGLKFEVFTEEGKYHESGKSKSLITLKIFGYDDGSYGAVLFL